MEPQQLATKVAQLESRVATLEDEGKIVRGEVKQILTEIRTAILARENPFEGDGGLTSGSPMGVGVTMAQAAPPPVAPPQPKPEPAPRARKPEPEEDEEPAMPAAAPSREPVMLRPQPPQPVPVAPPAPEPQQPQWTLLTIAGLSAWAEEAMRRLGSLRLEILLDMCEAAGHLAPDARQALSRVTEMDIPEPLHAPSTNETVVMLRQLDALVNDEDDHGSSRLQRRA